MKREKKGQESRNECEHLVEIDENKEIDTFVGPSEERQAYQHLDFTNQANLK